jgi:hypothetical protein
LGQHGATERACHPGRVPQIHVVDSTWIGVRPAMVGALIADPANWQYWWPELGLRVSELRGPKGVRWTVHSIRGRAVTGSMEVWLQDVDGGTVAHYFLLVDGIRRPVGRRERARLVHRYRVQTKRAFWSLADRLDPARLARLSGPCGAIP